MAVLGWCDRDDVPDVLIDGCVDEETNATHNGGVHRGCACINEVPCWASWSRDQVMSEVLACWENESVLL